MLRLVGPDDPVPHPAVPEKRRLAAAGRPSWPSSSARVCATPAASNWRGGTCISPIADALRTTGVAPVEGANCTRRTRCARRRSEPARRSSVACPMLDGDGVARVAAHFITEDLDHERRFVRRRDRRLLHGGLALRQVVRPTV